MLIDFQVANFRSIRELQTLSMVASNTGKELPGCLIERKLPHMAGFKFLKGAAIYGANASGKSNLLKALWFLKKLVVDSALKIKPGEETGVVPFLLDKSTKKSPTVFDISFVAENVRYRYGVSLNATRILEEFLIAYPKGAAQKWYHRSYDEDLKKYQWSNSSYFKIDESLQDKTRENALFLSVAAQFNHKQLTSVYLWFKDHLKFMNLSESLDMDIPPFYTGEKFLEENMSKRIKEMLLDADFGISDIKVQSEQLHLDDVMQKLPQKLIELLEKNNDSIIKSMDITLTHKTSDGDLVEFDLDDESAGTRRFFALAGFWLEFLDKGHTLIMDEIEVSLHPLLVIKLLQMVFHPDLNRNGAQLIFTTHNAGLLNENTLRRDQVWFTEKDSKGATKLYPLSDFKPRKDESLAKGYLAGRYGAIPFFSVQ